MIDLKPGWADELGAVLSGTDEPAKEQAMGFRRNVWRGNGDVAQASRLRGARLRGAHAPKRKLAKILGEATEE